MLQEGNNKYETNCKKKKISHKIKLNICKYNKCNFYIFEKKNHFRRCTTM